jgi:hypothetical protein
MEHEDRVALALIEIMEPNPAAHLEKVPAKRVNLLGKGALPAALHPRMIV